MRFVAFPADNSYILYLLLCQAQAKRVIKV